MGGGVPGSHDLRIAASQYEFGPAVISVNQGDRVTIELVSTDVVHGLYLDGYDLEVTADPGQTASLSFIADKSGTFRFRCSVTCGPLHPFMIGKLKVGNNTVRQAQGRPVRQAQGRPVRQAQGRPVRQAQGRPVMT
jgi:heme/copper-type cytochrome/quinol oxidase subunit 2